VGVRKVPSKSPREGWGQGKISLERYPGGESRSLLNRIRGKKGNPAIVLQGD